MPDGGNNMQNGSYDGQNRTGTGAVPVKELVAPLVMDRIYELMAMHGIERTAPKADFLALQFYNDMARQLNNYRQLREPLQENR
ncbi:MAG: hypothetical protein V1866_05960 [archaeon]